VPPVEDWSFEVQAILQNVHIGRSPNLAVQFKSGIAAAANARLF
jgi:hypothetical protein